MFCERGIRTFETYTRNTAGPVDDPHCPRPSRIADRSIDPSQGAGASDLVAASARARWRWRRRAAHRGASQPSEALSDGAQQVTLDGFARLMKSFSRSSPPPGASSSAKKSRAATALRARAG